MALKEASKALTYVRFEDINLLVIHSKRVTIRRKDLMLVVCMRHLNETILMDFNTNKS